MVLKDLNESSYDISLIEEGLMKYVCPKCNTIFDIRGKSSKCPSCGLNDEIKYVDFGIYPVLSVVDILYSLYEIVHIASSKQKIIYKKIQNNLKSELGKEFEADKIKNILIAFCEIKNSSGEMDFDKIGGRIKKILDLEDQYVYSVFSVFSTGDNHNRLYKSIVILTATLIEIVFKDYMKKVLCKKTSSSIASKIMESLTYKSIDEHINQINHFLEKDLKSQLEEVEIGYYNKWQTLKRQRNMLIHKNGLDISSKRADEIFNIGKRTVLVFMVLNNRLNER